MSETKVPSDTETTLDKAERALNEAWRRAATAADFVEIARQLVTVDAQRRRAQ